MTKTQEELNTLKTEYQSLTTKLQELTEEELNIVIGGTSNGQKIYYFGDAYKSSANIVYVVLDEMNTSSSVSCDYYNYDKNDTYGLGTYIGKTSVNRLFFKNYSFLFHIENYIEH